MADGDRLERRGLAHELEAELTRGLRHPKKRAFLAAYALSGNVTLAANQANVPRALHYRWKAEDETYAERFTLAEEMAGDLMEGEARRRAVSGVDEPLMYQGEQVGSVRRFSDTLLIFLLKGAKPAKYRERHEVSGPEGAAIPLEVEARQIGEAVRKLKARPVIDVESTEVEAEEA